MTALAVVMFVLALVMTLLACVDPRTVWGSTQGRQYRDPKALEPSGAALAVSRAGYALGAVALLVMGCVFLGMEDGVSSPRSVDEGGISGQYGYRVDPSP